MRHFSIKSNSRRTLCAGIAIAALSAIGLPIVGDRFYGRPSAEEPGVGRLMLHAHTLELQHPASGRPLRLEAPSAF